MFIADWSSPLLEACEALGVDERTGTLTSARPVRGVTLHTTAPVHRLALLIISKARGCCEDVGIQALINIALVGVRLRVEIDVLRPLACDIAQELMGRAAELNAIDVKQWDEVHRYSGIPPNLRTGS